MPDLHYLDPRLAALYDHLNPLGAGDAFYLALAGAAPKRVLDVGCGTGALACAFAARGHVVTGIDPAPAMLNHGRNRPDGRSVRWLDGDARRFRLGESFDFIVLTGHAFQVFLADADIAAALATLRLHLAPGGCLAFESRNPLVREWDSWGAPGPADRVEVPGIGAVEVRYEITGEAAGCVDFASHYRFLDSGETVTTQSRLRFLGQADLAAALATAGLRATAWYGDWDRAPYRPDSPEIIVAATPA